MKTERRDKLRALFNGLAVLAVFCLAAQFAYSLLTDLTEKPPTVFPRNRLVWQDIQAEVVLDLPADLYRQGGELQTEIPIYQGKDCSFTLSSIQQQPSGRYLVFFDVTNSPSAGKALTLGRMEYQPDGSLLWRRANPPEALLGEDWVPCTWRSYPGLPDQAHAQYSVTLDNARSDLKLWQTQTAAGQIRLRFPGLTLNCLEK